MGYYVDIANSDFFLPKEEFGKAYELMCSLNQKDELKSGGGWSEDTNPNQPRPEGLDYHPARWFSWMDANYPAKCKTVVDVFQELGFDLNFDSDENINGLYYSNKIGDESYFLAIIAPCVKDGSSIEWRGEDGEMWKHVYINQKMYLFEPEISWRIANEITTTSE
jgi:hypothetical protein